MSNKDEVGFEEKNALGGLDRLVTNIGLGVISVFPTLLTCLFMPWHLVPLISGDEPDGRKGILLSPGAFFVLALTVVLIMAAAVATDDTVASNGGAIGPELAVAVAAAASEGNIWKTASVIAPVYGLAISIGLLGGSLKYWAGGWWGLRVSFRAALYFIGSLVSWVILWSALIDHIKVQSSDFTLGDSLYKFVSLSMLAIAVWIYFWIFKTGGNLSWKKSGALSIAMLVLLFGFFLIFEFLVTNF